MRTILGWLRDLVSRVLGGGRDRWDVEPEAATVPDAPVMRSAPPEDETDTEQDAETEVPEPVLFGGVAAAPEPEPEPVPEPEPEPAASTHLALDAAGVGAGIAAVVIDGTAHPVASWREAVLVAARHHLEAQGSLPVMGYSERQRSGYAYQGDTPPRFFEAVGQDWHMKTKFNAKLAATVTRQLLLQAGCDPARCGFLAR